MVLAALATAGLTAASVAAAPGPAPGPVERELEIVTSDDVLLRGIVVLPADPDTRPESAEGWPVAILIHGHARNRDGLLPLADALADHGIAAVLFDQRGHGASRTRATSRTIYAFPAVPESHVRREVDDQFRVLETLRDIPGLDFSRVAIVGVGIGGLVAAEASWKLPHVRALVLVDAVAPIAGLEPRRDLALFGERPVLFVCSGFPQSIARARALAGQGHGERSIEKFEVYDAFERVIAEGQPGLERVVAWLVTHLSVAP